MRQIDGLWWPDHDIECHKAIFFLDDLRKTLQLIPRENRKLCLQAGGNCGVWAAVLADEFTEVFTAEPILENYLCLIKNVPGNVKTLWAALGSEPGTTGFHVHPENMGGSFAEGAGRVPIVTIDELQLPSCDLMVLDIEGMEPLAIAGAKETIKKYRPVIQVEDRGHSARYGFAEGWSAGLPGYKARKLRRDTLLLPC